MRAIVVQASSAPANASDVLNSWKEIAAYLKRGVRTVQRWEAEIGLPVRRPRGTCRSAVIAVRSDIDEWLNSVPLRGGTQSSQENGFHSQPNAIAGKSEIRDVIAHSRSLRRNMAHSRDEFQSALDRLIISLQRITEPQFPGDNRARTGETSEPAPTLEP